MSLQDDIFDVEDALKGTWQAECFERLMTRFNQIEQRCVNLEEFADSIFRGVGSIKYAYEAISEGRVVKID